MSFIEGVGDEVVIFAVIVLVLILAATITFLLNSSPLSQHPQVSPIPPQTSSSQINENHDQQQVNSENNIQDDTIRNDPVTNSDQTPPNISNNEETHNSITEDSEVVGTNEDNEVRSGNSQIYPDLNENVTSDSATEASTVESEERQPTDPDAIHVRLKYLDDTERTVMSNPTTKIGDFKRTHFAEDIANNKVVRLIFSGQLLRDTATLQSYGVTNNCVIHVQVLQAQTQQNPAHVGPSTDLDLSHLLWPLLSVILGICWILYFKYPEFFNLMSLGMLFLFTGSFIYFYSQIQHQ